MRRNEGEPFTSQEPAVALGTALNREGETHPGFFLPHPPVSHQCLPLAKHSQRPGGVGAESQLLLRCRPAQDVKCVRQQQSEDQHSASISPCPAPPGSWILPSPGSSPTPAMPSQVMNGDCFCESIPREQPSTTERVAGWTSDVSPWSRSPGGVVWPGQSGHWGSAGQGNHPAWRRPREHSAQPSFLAPHLYPPRQWVHNTNSLGVPEPTGSPGLIRMPLVRTSGYHPSHSDESHWGNVVHKTEELGGLLTENTHTQNVHTLQHTCWNSLDVFPTSSKLVPFIPLS